MRRGALSVAAVAVVAGVALAGGVGPASADVVWLCQPGQQDNPCRDSLETTVYGPDGSANVENPPLPADPPVDCFYVYPTVSEQRGPNSDKKVEAQQRAIAQYQASRFSQTCRVWAPMYRQQTLVALTGGGSAEALQLAYRDVAEAWREYLAKHNDGRGFVLIGHSQGSRMLRALLRNEVDPDPNVRRRLVSAVLLGGNVTVRKGQTTGGDFQNVPLCTRAGQVGCVFAWSTFNETPPSNSRYGRVPAKDDSGLGFPAGDGFQIACTNPAAVASNERAPLTTYLRSEPFPGILGALLVEMYGGPPPTAPTPWLEPADRYTGRCEERDGANVLLIEPIGSARRLNPSPDPTWGLHLADANIALGNLVPAVQQQVAAYGQTARPRVRLVARYARGKRPRRCVRGNLRLGLAGADARTVARVEFRLARRLVIRRAVAPFKATVKRSRMKRGVRFRIRATVTLQDGRRATLAKTLRACRN
jgi:hypothetical protein